MSQKQLLVDVIPFEVKPEILRESMEKNNGRIRVKGVLQRAESVNQNGRVYHKTLLEREVKKYMQLIQERRALGELDHPDSCFSESAEILTMAGWRFIKDISNEENVLTLNMNINKPEYKVINEKIVNQYEGIMYRFKGKNIDTLVTPTHRFVVEDRHGKLSFKTAEELYELIGNHSHLKIPKSNSCWEYDSLDKFILQGVTTNISNQVFQSNLLEKYSKDVEIPYDVWMSFMGIYLSEGHCQMCRRDGKTKSYTSEIVITQKHPEKTKKIKELLSKFPNELQWKIKTNNISGKTKFTISDARLLHYLYPLGSCYDKYVPEELKNQSTPLLELLLEWYHLGDGRDVYYKGYNSKSIFSTSKKMMEDFQEIQLKIGGNGNIIESICENDYKFAGRIIKKENKKPLYILKFNKSQYIHIDDRFLSIEKEQFNGNIYCVSVVNETFYARDNGKCFWSGNSVVNLTNVSHLITDSWWEGNDLWGMLEVLGTPAGNILKALFESGVKVGISSRGLGSTRDIGEGTVEVQDDYEILCWDMVSNPSTQGGFMKPILGESTEKVYNINSDKYTKVNKIVMDILSNLTPGDNK